MVTNSSPEIEGGAIERPSPFVPTPEKVSKFLDLKSEEVGTQMQSIEGRKLLHEQLIAKESDIRLEHPDFDPESLQMQLDTAGEALQANQVFLEDVQSPEKKGIFRRSWESVKGFAVKHPVATTLLGASVVAGGIAGGLYMAGYWETLMAYAGLEKIMATAEAVGELAPITPDVPALPGGMPTPTPLPGELPYPAL